ncbi:MAG: response regulator [Anaerolineae bacterium]|nr:response regulator [Anaerolineae bacterium]
MAEISNWDVIIVDDEQDNIGVVELVLNFNNATVRSASSGPACLQLLEEAVPTFLLVDIQMPGMSGYQLLDRIRENPQWREIPVIALTAHARPEDQEQILAAGFDGYISKPVSVMTLADELISILAGVV